MRSRSSPKISPAHFQANVLHAKSFDATWSETHCVDEIFRNIDADFVKISQKIGTLCKMFGCDDLEKICSNSSPICRANPSKPKFGLANASRRRGCQSFHSAFARLSAG